MKKSAFLNSASMPDASGKLTLEQLFISQTDKSSAAHWRDLERLKKLQAWEEEKVPASVHLPFVLGEIESEETRAKINEAFRATAHQAYMQGRAQAYRDPTVLQSMLTPSDLQRAREVLQDEDTDPEIKSLKDSLDKVSSSDELAEKLSLLRALRLKFVRNKQARHESEVETLRERKALVERLIEAWDEIEPAFETPKLQKAQGSEFPSLLVATREGGILTHDKEYPGPKASPRAQVFVVEHDWSSALKSASEMNGEYRLPSEFTAFEFQVSGIRCIAYCEGTDHYPIPISIFALSKIGWAYCGTVALEDATWRYDEKEQLAPIELIVGQIKAIVIAMDAEVVVKETLRVPHLSNSVKVRMLKPLYEYHTLSLRQRSRGAPLPSEHEPAYHVRMHFRRGHWRHYEKHKTWIRWMLVGDPDLGFIDKAYRL